MNAMTRIPLFIAAILVFSGFANGQMPKAAAASKTSVADSALKPQSSPAYAEVLLKRTELQSDLESLILEYTEDYPKVKELRYTLGLIQKETQRIIAVKPAETAKLTLALGKLMVKKVELETELWGLQANYKDDHPDVKRAKRKVEIYETAIKEILG
ncbi:MAG: hypothetical protein WBD27_17700 [Pyrinomonadaceae bacterium]